MVKNETKDAYMVLGYACNHRCSCCPCSKDQGRNSMFATEMLLDQVEKLKALSITDVTISGGEPTLHPDFFKIIEMLIRNGIHVHVLTNSDKFSDTNFCDKFIGISRLGDVSVTTTFHSHIPAEHEKQNQSSGSFYRSLSGLKYLDENGINVSVKHCITQRNYKHLTSFIEFALANFSDNTEIQLWGIDLCGVDKEMAQSSFAPFENIKPYLEEALDFFSEASKGNRIINVNNIPLCTCDCYYWNYFSVPSLHGYIDYTHSDNEELRRNSGPFSQKCIGCHFRQVCLGTYTSIFEMFGDNVVQQPVNENKTRFVCFCIYRIQ